MRIVDEEDHPPVPTRSRRPMLIAVAVVLLGGGGWFGWCTYTAHRSHGVTLRATSSKDCTATVYVTPEGVLGPKKLTDYVNMPWVFSTDVLEGTQVDVSFTAQAFEQITCETFIDGKLRDTKSAFGQVSCNGIAE